MEVVVKEFSELNPDELYDILKLRSEVFVVEQNCIYQDIDGKDKKAIHIMGFQNNTLVAYSRCLAPGIYFKEAAIGRVLVKQNERKNSYGHQIIEASITAIKERFNTSEIKISAQQYLIKFYGLHDFRQIGEGYLEDEIPHVAMLKK